MAEIPSTKLFYKIGEVCQLTGIRQHILRYWESEFKALSPKKSRGGQRVYQRKDLEMVMTIKRMLYEEGYTIAGAKKILSGRQSGHSSRKTASEGNDACTGTDAAEGRPGPCEGPRNNAASDKDNPPGRVAAPDARLADALGNLKEEIKDLLDLMG
jgi:DNA-binding transcriptional MerR regulator